VTAEEMAACAAGGRFWYMRVDGSFYGTDEAPENPGDVYLLDASPGWVAQWNDWEHAVEVMAPLFAQLDVYLEQL
jgi:hypothetical protein